MPADDAVDEVTACACRARDGDPEAARGFVVATQRDVWLLLVHLADRGVAEDLAQETYARAFRSLAGFRAESSARTWLLAIARRVAADHRRGARRRPVTVEPAGPPPDDAGDPADVVVLRRALAALDPDRRSALVVTQLIGLSYLEAADALGCPVGTIRSRVARARADLVAALDGVAGAGELRDGT